jgi:hypothetical protein
MPSKVKPQAIKQSAADKQKEQSARFIETARELVADESGSSFERAAKLVLQTKVARKETGQSE